MSWPMLAEMVPCPVNAMAGSLGNQRSMLVVETVGSIVAGVCLFKGILGSMAMLHVEAL